MNTSLVTALFVSTALLGGAASSASAQSLPQPVQSALYAAPDDEYHAQTFYAAVMAKFGAVRPFANIIRAEQNHANSVASLLQSYGLGVPANPYMSGDKPLEAVPARLQEACMIGMTAEIANVALYDAQLLPSVAGYADVVGVMQALRDASADKHLPAFQRCASGQLGQGHSQGKGQGQGHRQGKGKARGWRQAS